MLHIASIERVQYCLHSDPRSGPGGGVFSKIWAPSCWRYFTTRALTTTFDRFIVNRQTRWRRAIWELCPSTYSTSPVELNVGIVQNILNTYWCLFIFDLFPPKTELTKWLQETTKQYQEAIMASYGLKQSSAVSWLSVDVPTFILGPPEVHLLWSSKSGFKTPL